MIIRPRSSAAAHNPLPYIEPQVCVLSHPHPFANRAVRFKSDGRPACVCQFVSLISNVKTILLMDSVQPEIARIVTSSSAVDVYFLVPSSMEQFYPQ